MVTPTANHAQQICEIESLSWAICRVLKRAGQAANYVDVNAALGLSWLLAASNDTDTVAQWPHLARDWRIVAGADRLGIRLRDLHPPEAITGLARAAEYRAHFLDSYLPLISGALRSQQPVLAWQGWGGACTDRWGLIVEECASELGLAGFVQGAEAMVELTAPALQCYVVEQVDPRASDDTTFVKHCLEAAHDGLSGDLIFPGNVVTGKSAYALWRQQLQAESVDASATGGIAAAHATVADSIAANRACGVQLLLSHKTSLPKALTGIADELIDQSRSTAKAMTAMANVSDVAVTLKSGGGVEKLVHLLQQAESADENSADLADSLALKLR